MSYLFTSSGKIGLMSISVSISGVTRFMKDNENSPVFSAPGLLVSWVLGKP
jgi:hypothetical protein